MPGHAFIRGRELGDLLLPGAEIAQLALLIPKNSVKPAVRVKNVVEVGLVENRELLDTTHMFRPPGIIGLARAVVLARELVAVVALSSLLGVDRVGHPGFSHGHGFFVRSTDPANPGLVSLFILLDQGQRRYSAIDA